MDPAEAFGTLDLRVGRILRAEPNERARKPAYKLWARAKLVASSGNRPAIVPMRRPPAGCLTR